MSEIEIELEAQPHAQVPPAEAVVDPGEAATEAPAALGLDDPERLRAAVEAVLFVVESPVSSAQLAVALQRPEPEVVAAIGELTANYDERGAGIELREIAGGWR